MNMAQHLAELSVKSRQEQYQAWQRQRIPMIQAKIAKRLECAAQQGKDRIRVSGHDMPDDIQDWLENEGFHLLSVNGETVYWIVSF